MYLCKSGTKMKRLTSYVTCVLAGLLAVTGLSAGRVGDVPPQAGGKGRAGYMGYRVERGDTAYYDSIDPAWIFPRGYRGGKRDLKKYYRLVYNFNKVYPYALLAKDMEMRAGRHITQSGLKRGKKEKYVSRLQKELLDAYEKPLRNMTISQGKLLIKLVDREIGKSSYSIIKDYKSGISAGFWQGVAKIFGQNLKSHYDPNGEDRITEYLVEKWQRGEFDALYYSIFWEMPKHPDIVSKEIKFDE
ncbi:MAG TPA: hypothetical protein DDX40_02370 [Rikenellaceae bacterium]|nr:hypothetical protein [Rikenellaceae bacterium]